MKNFLLKTCLTILGLLVGVGTLWAEEVKLTQSCIYNNGTGAGTGYSEQSLTDENGNKWDAYAIKNYHSKDTKDQYYLQIKKYASNVAYYIHVPTLGTKITQLKMTVSGASQPMVGGGNSTVLYFSSSKSTSSLASGVVRGTGSEEITIDASSLNLNTGYITASAAIRIWDITVTYETGGSTPITLQSLTISGKTANTTYTEGDKFDPAGLTVTGTYSDNLTATITEGITWNVTPETLTAGTTSVSVTATVNNVTSAAYTVDGLTVNAITEKSIADFIASEGGKCYLIGTVSAIKNTTYGNYTLTDGSGSIYVYGTLTPNGEAQKFASLGIDEGNKIKVLANEYELFNGTQEAKNVIFVEKLESDPVTKYTITIANDIANGIVTANTKEAAEGATVTLTATPANGYEFNSWNVTNTSTSEQIDVENNQFTMPASDVTVSATFTESQQGRPENEIFYESFNTNEGTGGNDDKWSGSIASNNIQQDNEGWIFESGSGADKCAKFGTGSKLGTATTPALAQACNATLTFKAAAWSGNSESTTLKLSVIGGGTISPATVTLTKGAWNTFTATLTDLTTDSKIKFEGNSTSNSRFFLDEVSVVKTSDVKVLSSISVKTAPSKVVYTEGEIFDPTGLIITADYGTDGTEDVAYAGNEGKFTFNPVLTEALATTNTVVTITYGGKTTKQTITVNELPKYTVTFDAQAGSCDTESLTESISGKGITLPSATCYDEEWTFAGWATAACNETTTAPTLYKAGATYKPTSDVTLYAVYMTGVTEGETAFNRVTDISELTNGKRVVVVSNATNRVLTLTGSDTHTQENPTSITESEGKYIWTLGLENDIYTLTDETSGHRILSFQSTPNPGNNQTGISKWQTSGGYKKEWKISASEVENCWIITNTAEANQGGYAALYLTNPTGSWGALNLQTTSANKDEFAMRIYAEGSSISATYDSNPIEYFNLTISSAGYATYYNAFAYKMPKNVVGKIMVCEDGVVKSKQVFEAGDVVPVETPLLLRGTSDTYTLVETTEEATKSAEGNLLRGSHVSETTTGGSEQAKYYKFSNGDNGYGWYYGSKDNTTGAPFKNGAHKAYLVVEPDQSMSTRFIAIDSEGVLTDIEGINVDDTNGNVYDLQGRRVQRAGNGIYIKNGKKVIF